MNIKETKPKNVREFRNLCDKLIAIRQSPKTDTEEKVLLKKKLKKLAVENPELPQKVLWQIEDEEVLKDPLFLKVLEQLRAERPRVREAKLQHGRLVSVKPKNSFGKDD